MDWQRVSHILFTWISTLKHEVLTAVLEMHGESHSELKISSGCFFCCCLFVIFFFFFFILGCFSATVTQSRLQKTCAGEDRRVLSFPMCCRAGQRPVSTTDELKMSSRHIATGGWGGGGGGAWGALSVAPAGSPMFFVSTQATALCLLARAGYSAPPPEMAVPRLQH